MVTEAEKKTKEIEEMENKVMEYRKTVPKMIAEHTKQCMKEKEAAMITRMEPQDDDKGGVADEEVLEAEQLRSEHVKEMHDAYEKMVKNVASVSDKLTRALEDVSNVTNTIDVASKRQKTEIDRII